MTIASPKVSWAPPECQRGLVSTPSGGDLELLEELQQRAVVHPSRGLATQTLLPENVLLGAVPTGRFTPFCPPG